jgi:intein/homing endonuclease
MKENKYLAYLTGVYLSDGSCFKQNRGYVFKLSSIDMSYIDYTNKCLNNLINKTGSIYENKPTGYGKKNMFTIRIYEKELFEYLTIQTEEKTKIPTWILNVKESIKKEFIAGMVDGDGWVVFNVSGTGRGLNWQIGLSGSEIMMKNISRMCNKMKLKSWGPTKIKTSKNTYRLFFDVLDFIKFKIKLRITRKDNRIKFIKKILRDYMLVSKTKPQRIADILG